MVKEGSDSNMKNLKHKFQGHYGPRKEEKHDHTIVGCYNCEKSGHIKIDCRSSKRQKTDGKSRPLEAKNIKFVVAIFEVNVLENAEDWWIDSGATRHMCNDKKFFTVYDSVIWETHQLRL